MKRKLVVILLSLMMIVTLIPTFAFANETPTVTSINVEPMEVWENTNGFMTNSYYDPLREENVVLEDDFFAYCPFLYPTMEVTYSDGTTEILNEYGEPSDNFDMDEFSWDFGSGEQKPETYVIGDNEVNLIYKGFETSFTFTIKELPFTSVKVLDCSVYERTNGWIENTYYDEETGKPITVTPYWRYNPSLTLEITMDNGDVVKMEEYDLWEQFNGLTVDNGLERLQGRKDLKVGTYDVPFNVGKFESTYKLTINELPIKDFTVHDETVVEHTNGNWETTKWDEDAQEYVDCDPYYLYYSSPMIDITWTNGEKETMSLWDLEDELGCYFDVRIPDAEQNGIEAKVGTHKGTVSIGKLERPFNFIITEFPIKEIQVDDVVMEKYSSGYWSDFTYVDDEEVPLDEPFYFYMTNLNLTITYKDGTKETLTENAANVKLGDLNPTNELYELQWDNPLDVGTYKDIEFAIGDAKTTYNLTITEFPETARELKDRIHVEFYLEPIDEYESYDLPSELYKLEYSPETGKYVAVIKTEKAYINEGHTKEEYEKLLTTYSGYDIADLNGSGVLCYVYVDRPNSLSNPVYAVTDPDAYGVAKYSYIEDMDDYKKNPSKYEKFQEYAYSSSETVAAIYLTIKMNNGLVTFEEVESMSYEGILWKAETNVLDEIKVEFFYDDPKATVIDNSKKNAYHVDTKLNAHDINDKILTKEDLELVAQGKEISIEIKAADISKSIPKKEKESIKKEAGKDANVCMYLDIDLTKSIDGGSATEIHNTNGAIEITIDLPESVINTDEKINRTYVVLRLHDGEVTVLPATVVNGKLTFATDKFSTYAVAYTDTDVNGKIISPETLVVNYELYIALIALVVLGITLVISRKSRKEN